MTLLSRSIGPVVELNNRRVRRSDPIATNPRDVAGEAWNLEMESRHASIGQEWDRFVAAGGRLPRIEDLLGEDQGNEGAWRAGLLYHAGRPVVPLADRFPTTLAALGALPGLLSALWSVLDPGTVLPQHCGPNAGVLRYHLGVRCGDRAGLRVAHTTVQYRDGVGVLFDDTVEHEAWNRGSEPRVTLFCELLRPLPRVASLQNQVVQGVLRLDPRYRSAPRRGAEWDRALNRIA